MKRVIAALLLAAPVWAQDMAAPLGIARQGSYFVGGREVRSDSLSNLPAYAASGTVVVDQVYVRFQEPVQRTGAPLVLIHGCCLTGMTWETTPDGRAGWDEVLLRLGHPVHVLDQAWRGRSASLPTTINPVRAGRAAVDTLPTVFAAGREDAWAIFRFGARWGETFPGMRFPASGLGEFWKQMVPDWNFSVGTPNPTVTALGLIARRVPGAVLVSHSQSGIYPFQAAVSGREGPAAERPTVAAGERPAIAAAERPTVAAGERPGIAGIVSIEPGACPAPTDDLAPYRDLPILVLWGDYVELSPRWAPRLANCLAFMRAANAAGGRVEVAVLPEMGIRGNSHMLMQDDNSHEIARWLSGWVGRNVRG